MRCHTLAKTAMVLLLLYAGAASAQPPGSGGALPAERGLYLGLALEQFRIKAQGTSGGTAYELTTRPVGLTARIGYYLFQWLALEGHASVGIHDDPNSGTIAGGHAVRDGETELKQHAGIALRPEYRFTFGSGTNFTAFGLLGYNDFEFDGQISDNASGTPATATFTINDSGRYWGGGLQMDGQAASLRLQYARYFDESDLEIEGYQIGVSVYFD